MRTNSPQWLHAAGLEPCVVEERERVAGTNTRVDAGNIAVVFGTDPPIVIEGRPAEIATFARLLLEASDPWCSECRGRNHGDCERPRRVSQTTETGVWCWITACCCGALS